MKRLSSSLNIILFLLLLIVAAKKNTYVTVEYPYIQVLPAHIEVSENDTLIYEDVIKDVAIYLRNDYVPYIPEIGATITDSAGSVVGTVTGAEEYGFYLEPKDKTSIHYGSSGTQLFEDERYVGFISRMDMSGQVFVVCY